mmetsp:Transcript_4846/g.10258  ORF Transcript_4846/g.10258 Transcript_4846/m.10258 type:complete len:225 (+) Transcript_4846:129-803(+)|eukprot:CAMPEP_0194308980 /NCGR_PEP_ID=MMETSP0171-20130528/5942_1 /TAXON_ID=218684 /ORGANISM="Corethron pennatum, Strain L29A3" /LENGTH=224 /DNA_ID=CAMNT_0039061899 /DNA_START=46 /DNA_END=720 /DNA_ORIENTATION=+
MTSAQKKPSVASKRREKRTILPPRALLPEKDFEASLHQLSPSLIMEAKLVFPNLVPLLSSINTTNNTNNVKIRELLAIPTYHIANFPILERNDTTEEERLRLFLRFQKFAREYSRELNKIDPSSFVDIPDIDGIASFSTSNNGGGGGIGSAIYDEVSSTRSLLGYSTFLYMGVQIVQHPRIHYSKLTVHTVVVWALIDDAKQAFLNVAEAMALRDDITSNSLKS